MSKDRCVFCKDTIDAFNENEFYRINSKVLCSLECFYNSDKIKPSKKKLKQKKSKK